MISRSCIARVVAVVLVIAALLLGARPVGARDKDPGEDRYDSLKQRLRKLSGTPTVDAVVEMCTALSSCDCEDAFADVLEIMGNYAIEPRSRANGGHPSVSQFFHNNTKIREAAIDALAMFRCESVASEMSGRKIARAGWEIRSAALEAMGRMNEATRAPETSEARPALAGELAEAVLKALADAVEDKHPIVREAGLRALNDWNAIAHVETTRGSLKDPQWQVRFAGIEGLTAIGMAPKLDGIDGGDKNGRAADALVVANVTALIDALDRERPGSRLRDDVHQALKKLSGKDYRDEPEIWRKWLEAWRTRREAERQIEEARRRAEEEGRDPESGSVAIPDPVEEPEDPKPGEPYFYGIKVGAGRNVFVLDVTGSMAWYHLQEDVDKFLEEEKTLLPNRPAYKGDCFLDLAKYELSNTINEMSAESWFTIAFYDSQREVQKLEDTLISANDSNKRRAASLVNSQTWGGDTNLYDGLVYAFGLPGYQDWTGNYVSGPDTVFLFTDGRQNEGSLTRTTEILEQMQRVYRLRHVRVNTIGVGTVDKRLLEGLAEDSNGVYRGFRIRVDQERESQRAHGPGRG